MSVSLLYVTLYSPVTIWLKLIIATLMVYGAWFILSKPSRVPETVNSTDN